MRKRLVILGLLGMLLLAQPSGAQIPVTEAGAAAQRVITLYNQGLAYIRQGEQVLNEYNMIRNQIEQIANQVKNLQRIPEGLNFMQAIPLFGNRLTGLLATANGLSFTLDQSARQ